MTSGKIAQIYINLLTTKESASWLRLRDLERINDWYGRAWLDKEISALDIATVYFDKLTKNHLKAPIQWYFYRMMAQWYKESYRENPNHERIIRKALQEIITHETLNDLKCNLRLQALEFLDSLYANAYKLNKITATFVTRKLLILMNNYIRQEEILEAALFYKIEQWHALAYHEQNYNAQDFVDLGVDVYQSFPESPTRQSLFTSALRIAAQEDILPSINPSEGINNMEYTWQAQSPQFTLDKSDETITSLKGQVELSVFAYLNDLLKLHKEMLKLMLEKSSIAYAYMYKPIMIIRDSSPIMTQDCNFFKSRPDPFNFKTPSPAPPILRSSQENLEQKTQCKQLKNAWRKFRDQGEEMTGGDLTQLAESLLQVGLDEGCSLTNRHKALRLFASVFETFDKRQDIQLQEREKIAKLCLEITHTYAIDSQDRQRILGYALREFEKEIIAEFYINHMCQSLGHQENLYQLTKETYMIGMSFLQVANTLDLSFKELTRVFHQAGRWLGIASKGGGREADLAFQEKKWLNWDISNVVRSSEQRKNLKRWICHIHGQSAYYKLGLIYLEIDPKRAQKSFKRGTFDRQFIYRAASAYYLGYLYALRHIISPFSEIDMRYWFSKANRWGRQQNQELRAVKCLQEWQQKALEIDLDSQKYAYVLTRLVEVSKMYGTTLPQHDLTNFVENPIIQEKARDYAKIYHETITTRPSVYQPCIAVAIGGGLSGMVSALQLARLQTSAGQPLFKVILRERNPYLMGETSAVPARLHLGGEYPLDEITANDCLHTSLLFYQMIPHGYTKIPAVTYLVDHHSHNQSEQKGGKDRLDLWKMIDQYKKLKKYYRQYYPILKNDPQFTHRSIFGKPENLFRRLSREEMRLVNGFAGGIVTHEPGLNPALLGVYLEEQLRNMGVEVRTNDPVRAAKQKPYGYKLYGNGGKKDKAHLVINAAWDHAIELDQDIISPEEKMSYPNDLKVFVRGMAVVDISKCRIPRVGMPSFKNDEKDKEKEIERDEEEEEEKTAFFGMLGEYGGMFSPFNDKIAWCYWPSKKGSYLTWGVENQEFFTITGNRLLDQQNWDNLENFIQKEFSQPKQRKRRAQAILDNLTEKYPSLQGAKAKDLIIRRLLSPEKKTERPHSMVRCWGKDRGWLQAISLKTPFVALTSLEVTRYALEYLKTLGIDEKHWDLSVFQGKEWLDKMHHWMEEWQLPPQNVPMGINLPLLFRLPSLDSEDELVQKARSWAKLRGLPGEMAFQ
jgi:hypothetical protein